MNPYLKKNYSISMPRGQREIATVTQKFIAAANDGDEWELYWIRRLVRYGITESLFKDIARRINRVQLNAVVVPHFELDYQSFEWVPRMPDDFDPNEEFFVTAHFARLLKHRGFDGLKRCELQDCRKYFVGNAKSKWCSDNCGSKYRARKMRMRNKERQML